LISLCSPYYLLKKYLKDYQKKEDFFKKEKWVSDLCADNKLNFARERAKACNENGDSYSNIYKAFDLLDKNSSESKKK